MDGDVGICIPPNCNHHASVKQNYVRPIPDSSHSTSISSSKLVSSHSKSSRRKSTQLPPIKSLLKQPRSQIFHITLGCNQESSPSKRFFRKKLPNASPNQYETRADYGGGEQGVGPPPLPKWSPPLFEEVIPMKLYFIITCRLS